MEFRKDNMSEYCKNCYELQEQLDQLKADIEKMSKGYSKLTEIVSPYMDDFTGYNEELGGFDLILCVKELLEQLDQLKAENETYKKMLEDKDVRLALNEIRTGERHLWYNKAQKLSQTLAEIKEIANRIYSEVITENWQSLLAKQILQKISEVK